ncbi:gp198 [Sphingomonas phage PAU]|uniref:gp198 n=1 Tax=Sphingomonas phage PAU TaxID=1150991 RepID=UPI0002573364|nr:gp198 [Sphingomonas phage PAU]AFF28196.1 gp198 [Sphingomonas phage PAU]
MENTDLQYRDNSYFNEKDYYIFESHGQLMLRQVEFSGTNWFVKDGVPYKATTVRCVVSNVGNFIKSIETLLESINKKRKYGERTGFFYADLGTGLTLNYDMSFMKYT